MKKNRIINFDKEFTVVAKDIDRCRDDISNVKNRLDENKNQLRNYPFGPHFAIAA